MRKQFSDSVYQLMDADNRATILIGDISHFLLNKVEDKFSDRFFNVGICEQSMIGMAAGMAMDGLLPIVHTIAPFCTERSFEQIKIDLCYQKTDVTIISVGSSFDYAALGCTHHCYEDVSILRCLPEIQVFVPSNSAELDSILKKTWGNGSPKYFKISTKESSLNLNCNPFDILEVRISSSKNLVIVNGHLVDDVMKVEDCDVILCSTLSQLKDSAVQKLVEAVSRYENVFTIEENSTIGGLGDMILDVISCNGEMPKRFKKIGIPKKFLTNYGTAEQHRKSLGLNTESFKRIIENGEILTR